MRDKNTYEVVYSPTLGVVKTVIIECEGFDRDGSTYTFVDYTETLVKPGVYWPVAVTRRVVHNVAMIVIREPGTTPLDSNAWEVNEGLDPYGDKPYRFDPKD